MTEKKMENPYYTLGEAFVASVVAGNRGKITGNQIGLSDRLRQYAYYLTENMVETGDGLLVNDLLDAARQLERGTPIQPLTSPGCQSNAHRVTIEGNSIVDDHDRRTIAKFDLYNGSREELQAIADRANAPAIQPQRMREALEGLVAAARHMPRQTPAPGGAATLHKFLLSAGAVWELDRALEVAVAALTRPECLPTENKGE